MASPARAGVLIYASDLDRLASFYEHLLDMHRVNASAEHVVLTSPDMQLIIHAIPAHISATFEIETPPERREEAAIKPFFTVASLDAAGALMARLGASLDTQQWHGPGFRVRNGIDPEGNVIQLREFVS